jgi:hypothetical protein
MVRIDFVVLWLSQLALVQRLRGEVHLGLLQEVVWVDVLLGGVVLARIQPGDVKGADL